MQPFRYCAEWIVSKTEDVVVERFIGWRRAGKRRLFQPFVILKVGQYRIALDGKSAVWDFINAIQPNMPKAVVNQGMKGEFVHEQPFAQDLQDFIAESQTDILVFQCAIQSIPEPNSTSVYSGYTATHIKAQTTPDVVLIPPVSWGESMFVCLPMRTHDKISWLPSLVVGDYPRIVIAQSLSESKRFDLETSVLISSVVLGEGDCADMRPHTSFKRTEPQAIISSIAETHHVLCDSDYMPAPCAMRWFDDRTGMRFNEIDEIEFSRAGNLFFLVAGKN